MVEPHRQRCKSTIIGGHDVEDAKRLSSGSVVRETSLACYQQAGDGVWSEIGSAALLPAIRYESLRDPFRVVPFTGDQRPTFQ